MEPEHILAKSIREISAEVAALTDAGIDSLARKTATPFPRRALVACAEQIRRL